MRYFRKVSGERVYLSPMNPDDVVQYTAWLNDPAVSVSTGGYPHMYSYPVEREALERMCGQPAQFAIVASDGDLLIGNTGLMDINYIDGTATLGIFIGRAEYRGKGYGAEAIRLLLGFGFHTLNLRNILLDVQATNAQAIACYEKCGFTEIGRRTGAKFIDGQYVDLVLMQALRDGVK
ncbi:MAG: GNAT family N-acetyltransferase [Oscillospiraceae bacterium]|jgi:RimJ/RimL family protein N-acetyltransferase|nr:GNAT family N-acetyltransferase [Oscillospiraceae bacterium]